MRIRWNLILFNLTIIFGISGCVLKADYQSVSISKINGISLAAAKELIDSTDLAPIKSINANWVALMPYAFIREGERTLNYNTEWQWIGERKEGIEVDIASSKKAGLKVMLKPHVWLTHGEYTGDFELTTEVEWLAFEKSYKTYILDFAQIAEVQHVELFCIGTEWRKFVKHRPAFWVSLIKDVRSIYTGKLTYSSNWDEYTETPFWKELDFIGVNAYFPLTEHIYPTNEELQLAWLPITKQLAELSHDTEKHILFTEYGYRSIEGTTIRPWESDTKLPVSMLEQQIALSALYQTTWNQKWMAGGFLWKWFSNHDKRGGEDHLGFTPQNKPSEMVVKEQYGKHN